MLAGGFILGGQANRWGVFFWRGVQICTAIHTTVPSNDTTWGASTSSLHVPRPEGHGRAALDVEGDVHRAVGRVLAEPHDGRHRGWHLAAGSRPWAPQAGWAGWGGRGSNLRKSADGAFHQGGPQKKYRPGTFNENPTKNGGNNGHILAKLVIPREK